MFILVHVYKMHVSVFTYGFIKITYLDDFVATIRQDDIQHINILFPT